MPKTNREYCRDYRRRKRANKIKKTPKSSTERVREFRARRKAIMNVENDNDNFTVQNNESDLGSNDGQNKGIIQNKTEIKEKPLPPSPLVSTATKIPNTDVKFAKVFRQNGPNIVISNDSGKIIITCASSNSNTSTNIVDDHMNKSDTNDDKNIGDKIGNDRENIGHIIGNDRKNIGHIIGNYGTHIGHIIGNDGTHIGQIIGNDGKNMGDKIENDTKNIIGNDESHNIADNIRNYGNNSSIIKNGDQYTIVKVKSEPEDFPPNDPGFKTQTFCDNRTIVIKKEFKIEIKDES